MASLFKQWKEGRDMSFNFGLLRELRQKHDLRRAEFAGILGISGDRLYRFESGQSLPGIDLLEKIARYLNVQVGAFFSEGVNSGEKPDSLRDRSSLSELINRLNKERYARKIQEERVLELEKLTEHLMYVNELQARLIGIFKLDLPKPERAKKMEALVKETVRDEKLRFNEILTILQLGRSELEHLLEPEKTVYRCKIFDDKSIMASTRHGRNVARLFRLRGPSQTGLRRLRRGQRPGR
jgi:transcriptional regulator with XRE-family HTH domain